MKGDGLVQGYTEKYWLSTEGEDKPIHADLK